MNETTTRKITEQALLDKFEDEVAGELGILDTLKGIEAVVGIPFQYEKRTLPQVVQTARRGLERMGLSGKSLVLCVGVERAKKTLETALDSGQPDLGIPAKGFLLKRGTDGKGWATCAIVKGAVKLKAPLLLLLPDLIPQPEASERDGYGFSPYWIKRMFEPVRKYNQDLALARFSRHPLTHPVEAVLTFPIVAGVFGFRLRQPTPGIFALSLNLMESCIQGTDFQAREAGIYGMDPWLIVQAVVSNFQICQVPLGISSSLHGVGKLEPIFRQVAHAMLHQSVLHARWWMERPGTVNLPQQFGVPLDVAPPQYSLDRDDLFRLFKHEFNRLNDTLFREIVPHALRAKMEEIAAGNGNGSTLTAEEWIEILRGFLIVYGFEQRFHPSDIVDGLFPFFLARLAGFMDELENMQAAFAPSERLSKTSAETVIRHEAELALERQADIFIGSWPDFRDQWHRRESETTSYLPRLGAWEFVPNVGVIVPQEIKKETGGSVWANQVYQDLIDRYRGEFMQFLSSCLNVDHVTDSQEILLRIRNFMLDLDRSLYAEVFPFALVTSEGAWDMTVKVFDSFSEDDRAEDTEISGISWQLTPEAAEGILKKTPPGNLIMLLGRRTVSGLLEEMEASDALAITAWTETRQYLDQVFDFLEKNSTLQWFHKALIKPVLVDMKAVNVETGVEGSRALSYLTGRVLVSKLHEHWGGEYPRLWFFLNCLENITGITLFSPIMDKFLARGRDIGPNIVKCLRGLWGRHALSAFNGFENLRQRIIAHRLRHFCEELEKSRPTGSDVARLLRDAADVYHLSITLPDSTFVSLCAWTWASYSHRGGMGAPTPLSSVVERDWASMDFLTSYMKRAEIGDEKLVRTKITELITQGQASTNLQEKLLGVSADPDLLVISQAPSLSFRSARKLVRQAGGPILEPIQDHQWESKYVLNAAAVRLDGKVYILYRAFGEDEISRIGLAWSVDGIHIEDRMDQPIFEPSAAEETAGCEDPRITVIGDKIYMLYTAWDKKLPQIAMASIPIEAFLEKRFELWKRDGLGFPGLENKDAVLYPDTFDGSYVVYHRMDPNMWISYLKNLSCPWPRTGQKIVVSPRPGMMWDGVKIGAGSPPIKTKYGWLNIYHGVDYQRSYRLGVLLMAPDDPSEILYQSPNPILEPETDYEMGGEGGRNYWVPHVVFSCGAVPVDDKQVLDGDDEIYVYYGAADTLLCVAKGKIRDILPIEPDKANNQSV